MCLACRRSWVRSRPSLLNGTGESLPVGNDASDLDESLTSVAEGSQVDAVVGLWAVELASGFATKAQSPRRLQDVVLSLS